LISNLPRPKFNQGIAQIKTDHFSVPKFSMHYGVWIARNKFASSFQIPEK
jgi:hypothetical protein